MIFPWMEGAVWGRLPLFDPENCSRSYRGNVGAATMGLMKKAKFAEIVTLGLVSHIGCIVSCFGVGASLTSCHAGPEEVGHPLNYPAFQLFSLVFAVGLAATYWKIQNLAARLLIASVLIAGLWHPLSASLASLSLQTLFIFRIFLFLVRKLQNLSDEESQECCCS